MGDQECPVCGYETYGGECQACKARRIETKYERMVDLGEAEIWPADGDVSVKFISPESYHKFKWVHFSDMRPRFGKLYFVPEEE